MKVCGIGHEVSNLLICFGNERPKVVNKEGNLETRAIGVDLENVLYKLAEDILNIHFPICLH